MSQFISKDTFPLRVNIFNHLCLLQDEQSLQHATRYLSLQWEPRRQGGLFGEPYFEMQENGYQHQRVRPVSRQPHALREENRDWTPPSDLSLRPSSRWVPQGIDRDHTLRWGIFTTQRVVVAARGGMFQIWNDYLYLVFVLYSLMLVQ